MKPVLFIVAVMVFVAALSFASGSSEQATSTSDSGPLVMKIVAQPKPNYGGVQNNKLLAAMEKSLNVKMIWDLAPASSYYDHLNLVMASGDLPDLFWSDPNDSFWSWVKSGLVRPLDDLYAKETNMQKVITPAHLNAVQNVADGKIYGVPRPQPVFAEGIYWRKDWLDKLGLKVPETLPEFEAALKAFATQDPNGDGKNDTYGLTMNSALTYTGGPIGALFPAFGIVGKDRSGGEWLYDQSGKVIHMLMHPDFLSGIDKLADYYKQGMIEPEFILNKQDSDMEQKFNQGKVGAMFGPPTLANWQRVKKKTEEVFPGSDVVWSPSPKGKNFGVNVVTSAIWGMWAISTDAKYPARIMDFLDTMYTEEWWLNQSIGIKGVHYESFDPATNKIVRTAEQAKQWALDYNPRMWFSRDFRDEGFYTRSVTYKPEEFKKAFAWNNNRSYYFADVSSGYYPPSLKALDEAYPDWRTDVNEVVNKIILGKAGASDFEQVLAKVRADGLDKAANEMTAFLSKNKQG